MIVNGQKLIKHKSSLNLNHWVSPNNGFSKQGDLWYQPDSRAVDYPSDKGRLLEYRNEETLDENDGLYYADWVEIPIKSVEAEVDDTKSPVQLVIDKYKNLHSIVTENLRQEIENESSDATVNELENLARVYAEVLRDLRNLL